MVVTDLFAQCFRMVLCIHVDIAGVNISAPCSHGLSEILMKQSCE